MKFSISISLLFGLSVLMIGCSNRSVMKLSEETYTGVLVVVGNEPFTSFALDDGFGHITILASDKKMEPILNKLQGNKVKVRGVELPDRQGIKVRSVVLYENKTE